MRLGFGQVMEDNQPGGQCMRGASDGSQRGKNGTYGWFLMTREGEFSSSGKVRSYTRELDSYRAELQGVLSMMAGAWKINKKAQVKAYCDNYGVVVGFKKMAKAIGRGGDGCAPVYKHSVDLWEEIEHWTLVSVVEATVCAGVGKRPSGG